MSTDKPTRYGIGTVARLTGLTTHNIRAWENRYAAIEAERDASGRRRYTPEQVERLAKLKQLVDLGERISKLSKLPSTALDERLTALRPETALAPARTSRLRIGIYGSAATALTRAVRQQHPQHKIIETNDAVTAEQLIALEPDVDCMIVATASLAPGLVPMLETLSRQSGERAIVAVYDFARDADLRVLAGCGGDHPAKSAGARGSAAGLHGGRAKDDGDGSAAADDRVGGGQWGRRVCGTIDRKSVVEDRRDLNEHRMRVSASHGHAD